MRNGYDLLQEIIFLAGSADVASASIYFFSARPAPPFSLTLFSFTLRCSKYICSRGQPINAVWILKKC
ncbi:hypothetical protein [Atlantibacter hermannii]|uniref:hypothetical protein n=1 Tax=Atlantibacter hermannii TaxID=565 RepID=UPI00332536A2